jgi:CRISPR-associated protein Cmr3
MAAWIIEPRDPLIVRDGRPFGPNPGARATTLSFPFPSTTTGGVRTRAGHNSDSVFDLPTEVIGQLKRFEVRGPLLVQLTPDGNDIAPNGWRFPAPLDALLLPANQGEGDARLQPLVPLQLPRDAQTDFNDAGLKLVGMPLPDLSKPLEDLPHYWNWSFFRSWLLDPSQYRGKTLSLATIGQRGLQRESRLHVSIDPAREIAKDGMLFETSGLEFTLSGGGIRRLRDAQRLALVVTVDDDNQFARQMREGLACFAGERRIVSWRRSNLDFPQCPPELEEAIIQKKAYRVVLLTPARFEKGFLPTWLLTEAEKYGVKPTLEAIAMQRPQAVSGWDLELKKPKPSRRLASAGTVIFLTLKGTGEAISTWVRASWMQCISDDPQDRADGFGLSVIGTWSGQPEEMQKGSLS